MTTDGRADARLSPAKAAGVLLLIVAAVAVGRGLRSGRPLNEPKTEAPVAQPVNGRAEAELRRGEVVYLMHCAKCHGPEGRGDGEAAEKLRPPPRDFARRPWRFEPTATAIRRVTRDGIPGTAMPAAKNALSDADMNAVTAYVLQLAATESPPVAADHPLAARLRAAEFTPVPPKPAPTLTLADADDGRTSLAENYGHWVLINFWGTSCEHCLRAMPTLHATSQERADQGLTVLLVCADSDDAAEAQALATKIVPGVRIWVDDSGLGPRRFDVTVLPTTWLINPAGETVAVAHGMHDWRSPAVRQLLDALTPARSAAEQR